MQETTDKSSEEYCDWTCGICKVHKRVSKNAENFTVQCNCGSLMIMRDGKLHFISVKDFAALGGKARKYICPWCLKPALCIENNCLHTTHYHADCHDKAVAALNDVHTVRIG